MIKFRIDKYTFIRNSIITLLIFSAFYLSRPISTTQTLFVPKGSISHIITQLSEKGYDVGFIDKYILLLLGKPQNGWVRIGANRLNRIDFLYKITTAKAQIHKITLIPGETLDIFFNLLVKKLKLDKSKLIRYYKEFSPYPEAGIYPDTYFVPFGIKENHLILFLINQTDKKYRYISNKIFGEYSNKNWLRILIIASIIQKEAGSDKEMPLVSSVIHNRLKKSMRLQMDGTLNYGKYSHIKVTPKRIREDKSTFNTYRHKGLPTIPIGSVSLNAIKSAIVPPKTNYLYFMKNSKGHHDFTDTFKAHRKNIENSK